MVEDGEFCVLINFDLCDIIFSEVLKMNEQIIEVDTLDNPMMEYFRMLEQAYSVNFTSHRVLEQFKDVDEVDGRVTTRTAWARQKIEEFAKLRNQFYADNGALLGMILEQEEAFCNGQKALFLDALHKFYPTENKKGSDSVCEFEAMSSKFQYDYESYAKNLSGCEPPLDPIVFEEYEEYLNDLQIVKTAEAVREIFELLRSEFSESGFKTIFFDHPATGHIAKIDKGVIESLKAIYKQGIKELSWQKREISTNLEWNRKEQKHSPNPEVQDIAIEKCLTKLDEVMVQEEELEIFNAMIKMLERRFKSTVKDTLTISAKIKERFNDFATMSGLSALKRPTRTTIYFHKKEYEIMRDMLKFSPKTKERLDEVMAEFFGKSKIRI